MAGNSQNYNRYSYCLNNPLIYIDPSGEFFWIIPNISWSKSGGLSIGISVIVGIPGVASVQAGIGYNFKHSDFNAYTGATAAFNTVYRSYSTKSGFSVGWSAGLSPQMGFPISSNFTSVGVNYNITHDAWSGNLSAWTVDKTGFTFDPSFSAMVFPERTTNLARGQGFRSNDEVFNRFVTNEQYQEALDYFGFEGKYNPDSKYAGYVNKSGEIMFGKLAFEENFDYLSYVASEEAFHRKDILSRYKNINWDDELSYETLMAKNEGEFRAKNYQYKNQGLFKNAYGNKTSNRIISDIDYYGVQLGSPSFKSRNWHFIYKIKRKW